MLLGLQTCSMYKENSTLLVNNNIIIIFTHRTNGLAYCTTFAMTMTGLEVVVIMEIYLKTIPFHGLTRGLKILKPFKKSFLTLHCWRVSTFTSNLGKYLN